MKNDRRKKVAGKIAVLDEDLPQEETQKFEFINVRLEPGLREKILEMSQLSDLTPGAFLRRLAIYDIVKRPPDAPFTTKWPTRLPEFKTRSLSFALLPILGEAIRKRAAERNLKVAAYIRSLATTQFAALKDQPLPWPTSLSNPASEKGAPSEETISGYTTYSGELLVGLIRDMAEKKGMSLAAYQKALVYRELEKEYSRKFIDVLLEVTREQWDTNEEALRIMLTAAADGSKA